ncbi:DUF3558 domain-containing protein [Actinophytocola sp.]|uniref:DUF3558 domain-containing protein n=1 Tax=Actinophytocola sp. TaxID=1872138 RepID=UPI003D6B3FF2
MIRPFRAITCLSVVLLTGLAAGCTTMSTGDPRPDDVAATSSGGDPAETTSSTQPNRPRDIPLDDVDPCTLLPEADYPDYYLDNPGEPRKDDQGAAACLWLGEIGYMGATLVTYEDIDEQDGRYGQVESTDPIDDFPTYTIALPNDDNRCFTAVDVADGQYLIVQIGLDSVPTDIPPVCEYSHQFAAALMSTLVDQ